MNGPTTTALAAPSLPLKQWPPSERQHHINIEKRDSLKLPLEQRKYLQRLLQQQQKSLKERLEFLREQEAQVREQQKNLQWLKDQHQQLQTLGRLKWRDPQEQQERGELVQELQHELQEKLLKKIKKEELKKEPLERELQRLRKQKEQLKKELQLKKEQQELLQEPLEPTITLTSETASADAIAQFAQESPQAQSPESDPTAEQLDAPTLPTDALPVELTGMLSHNFQ